MPNENALQLLDDTLATIMRLAQASQRVHKATASATALATAEAYEHAAGIITEELRPAIERLTHERDAALAAVAGRTTAPTDAELDAHEAAGGRWLVTYGVCNEVIDSKSVARARRETSAAVHLTATWWALNAAGCPCAWPVAQ